MFLTGKREIIYIFCVSGKLLQVNTGDSEVLYFEAPRGKQQFINREDAEDITWATWTSVLGPSVQGVWPAYTDVTDVNAACVSHDGEVISTGDDFGFVKLFKYPSYVSGGGGGGGWKVMGVVGCSVISVMKFLVGDGRPKIVMNCYHFKNLGR